MHRRPPGLARRQHGVITLAGVPATTRRPRVAGAAAASPANVASVRQHDAIQRRGPAAARTPDQHLAVTRDGACMTELPSRGIDATVSQHLAERSRAVL